MDLPKRVPYEQAAQELLQAKEIDEPYTKTDTYCGLFDPKTRATFRANLELTFPSTLTQEEVHDRMGELIAGALKKHIEEWLKPGPEQLAEQERLRELVERYGL